MPSKYDQEKLVGILLRRIVGEIVRDFRKGTLRKIYADKSGNLDDISKHCMEWNDEISKYFSSDDPQAKKKKGLYKSLLLIFEIKKIDPDTNNLWRMLMKKDLPDFFYKRFESFGQVPQVASLDTSEPPESKGKIKDIKDVGW